VSFRARHFQSPPLPPPPFPRTFSSYCFCHFPATVLVPLAALACQSRVLFPFSNFWLKIIPEMELKTK
jgi:hypothetical protein